MIKLDRIKKKYLIDGKEKIVLDSITLSVKKGEFVAFFGPNACGKSTLINILAELIDFEGKILFNGKKRNKLRRGMVFQNFNDSLLPWRTVYGNISLALEGRGFSNAKINKIIDDYLDKMNLSDYKNEYIFNLSGGKKQLVAICRAFASDPDILLMDEPFSSLDYITKISMLDELLLLWNDKKTTTFFVSHDIDEALYLADRVVVFSQKPTKIIKEIKVPFKRPRKSELISSSIFENKRKEVLKIIENEKLW